MKNSFVIIKIAVALVLLVALASCSTSNKCSAGCRALKTGNKVCRK